MDDSGVGAPGQIHTRLQFCRTRSIPDFFAARSRLFAVDFLILYNAFFFSLSAALEFMPCTTVFNLALSTVSKVRILLQLCWSDFAEPRQTVVTTW